MPNHIANELVASKLVVDSLAGDCDVDFNTVIPMPKCLTQDYSENAKDWAMLATGHYTLSYFQQQRERPSESFARGDYGSAADALHAATLLRMLDVGPFPKDFSDADFSMYIDCIRAVKETGFPSWYEWATERWGTKWNAYECKRANETTLRFQTAWSAPLPVALALSKKFPGEAVAISWADEDYGANVGSVELRNGEISKGGRIEDYSSEAYALVLRLHFDGVVPEHMEMVGGVLKYREDAAEIAD